MNSTDPQAMLTCLRDSGRLSERKGRLFLVACCHRLCHLLNRRWLACLEVAEEFADGYAAPEDLRGARAEANTYVGGGPSEWAAEPEEDFDCTFYYHALCARECAGTAVLHALGARPLSVDTIQQASSSACGAVEHAAITAVLARPSEPGQPTSDAHPDGDAAAAVEAAKQADLLRGWAPSAARPHRRPGR
jgi:hypothetical protein